MSEGITTRRLIFRPHLKVILDSEVIDGRIIWELYIAVRGRGAYVGWGGAR